MDLPFVLIAISVLLVVGIFLALLLWKKNRNRTKQVDYRAFFFIGICFLFAGITMWIALDNPGMAGMTALGVIYIVLGLSNRDKWKK